VNLVTIGHGQRLLAGISAYQGFLLAMTVQQQVALLACES
jgi:hypothetical protein